MSAPQPTSARSNTRRTVFVTGASGVIGAALLPELLPDFDVIGLVRTGTLNSEQSVAVRGDLTAPRLGLTQRDYDDLVARTDVVVHSAGLVDWGADPAHYEVINVGGTERILELAVAAGAPVHHVSTAFVQSMDDAAPVTLAEDNPIYHYVRSKIAADELFAASGVPHSVVRPSNLLGDSRTGEIAHNQFVQRMAIDVCRGRYPFLPARPAARMDMTPQDVCAQSIAAIVCADDLGSEYWLTYGPDALTVADTIALCLEFAQTLGRPVVAPRIVDPDDAEAVERELAKLPDAARMVFPRLLQLSDAMSAGGVFPTSFDVLHQRYGLRVPELSVAFLSGLEYWARSREEARARRRRDVTRRDDGDEPRRSARR